jgi:hypothetical protein
MFAFADPQRVSEVLTAGGWAPPQLDKLDLILDIATGYGLEEAIVQSTQIGAVNSWLRNQPGDIVSTATTSLREAVGSASERRERTPAKCMWLVSSEPA